MFKGKGLNSVFPILIASLFFASLATAQEWVSRAPMPTGRPDLAAGVINGILYAVGGWSGGQNCSGPATSADMRATVEAYDPAANTWTAKAPMPRARRELAVGVVNGILYAVGGESDPGTSLSTVEAYDPSGNTWTSRAPMPTARRELAAGVVNGILYAVGGHSGGFRDSIYHTTVEAYDPATNTWTAKAPMPTARNLLAVAVVNGILYAAGGTNGSAALATVEAYDPATNTWTTKASMPTPRAAFGAGAINGILHTVGPGGADQPNTLYAANTSYDPATNTWTVNSPMPTARQELAIGVVNGVLYALGGCPYAFPGPSMNVSAGLTKVEAYTPPANPNQPVAPPPVTQTEYTVTTGVIPQAAVTTTASGTLGSVTLNVTLNLSLLFPAGLSSRQSDFAAGYNVYVAALVPGARLGLPTAAWFMLPRTRSWTQLAFPIAAYLENVAQGAAVSVDILQNIDMTQLVGTEFYIGYGLSDQEMLAAGRYRGVYIVR